MYNKLKAISFTVFIIILFSLLAACNKKEDKLVWTAINVSNVHQGDAHLIHKGNNNYLIDTGEYLQAKSYLLPSLESQGVTHLNGIIITHPHFDHYGGTTIVLESNITVDHIYMNMPTRKQMKSEWWGGEYKHLLYIQEIAKKKNIPISPINKGDKYTFDKKSYMKVLYAYDGIHTPVGKTDINDMSAIIMIYDDKNRFLLAGDLNNKLGTYLATHAKDIQADILKVPHHGTESFAPNSFFYTVAPKVIIVPAPKDLWCSDRSKRTKELIRTRNYKSYINGFHGDITVTSFNNTFKITTTNNPSTKLCK